MATIKIKRGLQAGIANLSLAIGELALATDTGNVYIGTTAGSVHINPTGGISDETIKLQTPREFSATGDVTAPAVTFNGTQNVNLALALATMSGLTAGTYTKLSVDTKGRVTAGTNITIDDLPDIPKNKITGLPTKVSEFTNDAAYQTATQVSTSVAALVAAAPETLNTLKELATALGDDPNFATTVSTNLGKKVDKITGKSLSTEDFSTAEKNKLSGLSNYSHPAFSPKASGLYKITSDAQGHISAAALVSKADITALGIPAQDTVYSLPTASASVMGGIKIGSGFIIANGVLSVGDYDGGTF